MKTTIDAMKYALDIISRTTSSAFVKTMLEEAIAHEEAQTVEPVGVIYEAGGMQLEVEIYGCLPAGTLLFTRPAPATEPAKPSAGEREALIEDLRALANELSLDYRTETIDAAADMLAADAQEIAEATKLLKESARVIAKGAAIVESQAVTLKNKAQQVAVPQEWTNLLTYVLQGDMHNRLTPRVIDIAYTAFTLAKRPNTEDGGASDWFNDTKPAVTELIAKLKKDLIKELPAPQPPQAAPRVPMTKSEVVNAVNLAAEAWDEKCTSEVWGKNYQTLEKWYRLGETEKFELIACAVEQFHGIRVKS